MERLEQRQLLTAAAAVGLETRVNTFTTNNQSNPSVAADAAGDYVITWQSDAQDGSGQGVFAQRYNAAGTAQGGEFQVNTFTTDSQYSPSVAMDAVGDFVIAWHSYGQDGNSTGIYARRYNAAGTAQGIEFKVNTFTPGSEAFPSVAMDAAGDFVITWQSYIEDQSLYGVYAQRYNAAGVAQGAEFRVNTYTTNEQNFPSVAMDAAGDFAITWDSVSQDGSSYGIFAQRYNAAGTALGGEFQVNTYTTSSQSHPSIAMDVAGDFVIAWNSNTKDGSNYGIYAQRYNAAGAAQGVEFQVNTYTTSIQIGASVAMDAAGDFAITWQSYTQDGSGYGVYAQCYNVAGAIQGTEIRVNTYTAGYQIAPSMAMDSAGDFVIAWQSKDQDGSNYGIYAQRYLTTVGPIVTGVLQGTHPRPIQNGDELIWSDSTLTVQFSEGLSVTPGGANSVVNPSNWGLYRNLADVSDLISGITFGFNASTNRWAAVISFFQPLKGGNYSLITRHTIQDLAGLPLDGEADGIPGGDFRRNFSVSTMAVAGAETRVNTYTTNAQWTPRVATDAVGDYVVTWFSTGQDGSSYGVYAQRYSVSGTPQGGEFRVNTYTTGAQDNPSVAMDAVGDFVIAWQSDTKDGSNYGIFAQRYNAAGAPLGGEFQVNSYTTSYQTTPSVAMDAAGDFVIAWQSYTQDGSNYGVYAQRYNAAGTAQGVEFRVNTYTTSLQEFPSVAMDTAGDFVIAWKSGTQDGNGYGVYAERYNALGAAQGSEFKVNTYTTNNQESPSVAMDAVGNFVITWSSVQDGSGYGVYAQRYNAAGTSQGGEFQVNTYTTNFQDDSRVAMDAAGDFVIVWRSDSQDGSQGGVFAQRYSPLGVAQGAEFQVNTYTTAYQGNAAAAIDAAGEFVMTWLSDTQDGSGFGIYAQRYRGDIAPLIYQIEATPLNVVASLNTPITSTLLASDQDSNNWTGATIQIAINYRSDQDVLAFTNTANITGSWNATTGTLTLTGSDTVSNYRAALRSVTYHNTKASPNTSLTRTINFQASDGSLSSNVISRDLTIMASSIPAVLSGVSGTGTYFQGDPAIRLAANLVITDPDTLNLASAAITFTNWQGEDRLDFNNIFALQHTLSQDLVAHTATFTITGLDTVDHYQTLLRSVIYWDVSGSPVTTPRVASFTVTDGLSTSNVVTRNTIVTAVNQPPLLTAIESSPLAYKANDPAFPPLPISTSLLVGDPDSNNLTKATVQISAGYQNDANGHDVLSFTNQLGITGSFNAATGTLTLSGTSGVGNYRTALRSVTFSASGSAVSTTNRTLTLTVTDDSSPTPATSLAITRLVSVSLTNTPPALTGIPSTPLAYVRGTAAQSLAPTAIVLDADSINLTGATIQVTGNYQNGQDVLAANASSGITVSFNATTGTLTLSGLSSLANYQAVLRTVTFKTNTAAASTLNRTVSFTVNDGLASSSPVTRIVTLT